MNDKPAIDKCVECKTYLIRVFNFSGVSFNGAGFYSNDKKEK
jgi:predicted nucleic acid-binding Zn ribbon protein